MSDEKEADKKAEKKFIKETIEQPQASGRKLGQSIILFLALGLVFGVSASFAFVISGPAFRKWFSGHQETVLETVLIPRDSEGEETTETELITESMTRDPEVILKGKELAAKLERNMVTVTSLLVQEDIFERSYTHSQKTFGVILAVTKEDIRILTESGPLEEADSVYVTFFNGAAGEAQQLGLDCTTGIAVISMPLADLDESLRRELEPAVLGNSRLAQTGDLVMALGEPLGHFPSIGMGIISSVADNVQATDINAEILHTNITGTTDACGLVVNVDGEVIGWFGEGSLEENSTMISAFAISDLKGLIEKLTNGERICLLGIKGQEVTEAVAEEQDIPRGVFVTEVVSGCPAVDAGIRNGDILVRIGEKNILTMRDLEDAMTAAEPGDTVDVVVMRSGRQTYNEEVITVSLEER